MKTRSDRRMVMAAWLGLAAMALLNSSCTPAGNGGGSSSTAGSLELSPGMQISSLISGGIAGLHDSIQVSDDWNLIVARSSGSFVRRLDGEEQAALRELLDGFADLSYEQSDGADIADGMSSMLQARGGGAGSGTSTDAQQLFRILNAISAEKVSE